MYYGKRITDLPRTSDIVNVGEAMASSPKRFYIRIKNEVRLLIF